MKYIRKQNCDVMELEGHLVVLNTEKHTVTTINEMGAFYWELLEQPQTIDNIVDETKRQYEGVPHTIIKEIEAFLNEMLTYQLIEYVQ